MSTLTWMFIAFMAVWLGLGAYLLSIALRQKRLEQRMAALDRAPVPNSDSP